MSDTRWIQDWLDNKPFAPCWTIEWVGVKDREITLVKFGDRTCTCAPKVNDKDV